MLALWILLAATLGILVHELGHVVAARTVGLGVLTVGVGFGPLIFARTDRMGTRWEFGLIPLGGNCAFIERAVEQTHPPGLLDLSPIKRAAIYAAGPLANILFFAALLFITILNGTPVSTFAITNGQELILLIGGLSLLLGLFNLIPVPPLDGGRLLLIAIERFYGTPLSSQAERSIFAVGSAALTVTSLFLSAFLILGSLKSHF